MRAYLDLSGPYMRRHIINKSTSEVTLHAADHVMMLRVLSLAESKGYISWVAETLTFKYVPDCPKRVVFEDRSPRDTA